MVLTASKILARTLLSVLVLVVVTALFLIAALSRGPLSLSFLGPYVDQIVADQYPELDLGFEGLELQWDGRDKNLVFGMTNMSVRKEQETVAYIPAVTVTFSADALMKGRLAPSGLEFTGLEVVLTRAADGDVRLGYSYTNGARKSEAGTLEKGTTPAVIHKLLADLGAKTGSSDLTAYLERLELYQFTLFVEDEKIEKLWQITSADLVVWKSEQGLNGRLQGDVLIGGENINIVFDAAYDRSDRTTIMRTNITDFPLSLLAKEMPELEKLSGADLSVAGDISISLDPSFQPMQVGFVLNTGAGKIDLPSLYKKPLSINSVKLEGHSAAPFTALNLNTIKIDTAGLQITMSGTFENSQKGFGMSIEGSIPKVVAQDVPFYWPYSAAADAYDWVTTNITEGQANNITFRVNLPAGSIESGTVPDGAIELKFDFDGGSVDYFAPLPKIYNITGKAILTEKQIHVFDLVGEVYGLSAPAGDVLLYDFDKPDQIADITLTVTGESRKIFEFLDKKPLGFATPYGIDPQQMTGVGEVDAQFVFPLRHDLTLEKVVFEAKGRFENAYIPNVYEELDLSGGDLAALVTPEKLIVKGIGNVKNTQVNISFQSWFKGDRAGTRRYEVVAKLDDNARSELGLVDTSYLSGPVGASLGVDLRSDGSALGVVTLNLLEAAIDIPELMVSKPVGVTGHFGAQFEADGQGNSSVSNIRLSSETMELVGKAELDTEGLKTFSASKLKFGENDLSVSINRRQSNGYKVDVSGRVFDLRPYINDDAPSEEADAATDETDPDADPNILFNIAIERALLNDGVTLDALAGYVDYSNGLVLRSEIGALLDGTHKVSYVVKPQGNGRHVTFQSAEAGALLRGVDIYDNSREGSLSIVAKIDDRTEDSIISGRIKIEKIRIFDAPVLGKILTIGSLTGIVELLENDGMTFETIEGPFTFEKGILKTKDFRAVGAIGLTFTGEINQEKGTLNGFGTVIPAYTLNSILGNIPILGRLLVGRKGEGIFGFSYKLKGEIANPTIIVNPVSALAPGILRRMFFEPWTDAGSTDTNPTRDGQPLDDRP